jgi:hypothetical protein
VRTNEAGYSLLEVLAAAALLVIALLAGAYMQSAQSKLRASTTAQLQGRKEVSDIMTLVMDNPEHFIYFEDPSNKPVVYVGCFNAYGHQISTAGTAPVSTPDWLGTFLINPANSGTASGQFNGILGVVGTSNFCTSGTGGWEIHVYPNPNSAGTFQISALALPVTDTSGNVSSSFSVSTNTVIRSNIALRAPAAALATPFTGTLTAGVFCSQGQITAATCAKTNCTPLHDEGVGSNFFKTNCGGPCTAASDNVFFCY